MKLPAVFFAVVHLYAYALRINHQVLLDGRAILVIYEFLSPVGVLGGWRKHLDIHDCIFRRRHYHFSPTVGDTLFPDSLLHLPCHYQRIGSPNSGLFLSGKLFAWVQEYADFSIFVVDFLKLVVIRERDAVPLGHHAWENFGTCCSFWKRHNALVCVLVQCTTVFFYDLSYF